MATYITSGSNGAESVNSTTHSVVLPVSVTAGDILIISAGLASSTSLTASGIGMSGQIADNINTQLSGHGSHVWVRTLASVDGGATITLTSGSSLKVAITWQIIRVPDIATTSPLTFLQNQGLTSSSLTAPSFTRSATKFAVFAIAGSSGSSAPPNTWTPPSNVTFRAGQGTGGTTGRSSSAIGDALTPDTVLGTGWTTNTAATWSVTTIVFTTQSTSTEITAVASGANNSEDVNDSIHVVSLPSGIQNDDTLVVTAGMASGTTIALTGAGVTNRIAHHTTSRSGHSGHVWILPLTAAMSATELSFETGIDLKVAIVFQIFRGSLDVSSTALASAFSSINGTSASSFNAPVFTQSATRIAIHAIAGSSGSAEPPTSWIQPSGMTLGATQRTGGGTGRSSAAIGYVVTKNIAVNRQWSTNSATTWSAVTITLSVSAVPSTPPSQQTPAKMKINGAWVEGSIRGMIVNGVFVKGRIRGATTIVDELPTDPEPEEPTPGATPSEGLWFDATSIQTPLSSDKMVVAHYFTPYPIKISNVVNDEYFTSYLNPAQSTYADRGGLSRNRPENRNVIPGVTTAQSWALDMEQEIAWAKESGIDGFVVDILGASGRNYDLAGILIDAAHRLNNGFRVIPMLDCNGNTALSGVATSAAGIARYAGKNGSHYLPDGRFLVTFFKMEGQTPEFYDQLATTLRNSYGLEPAFIGVFNSYNQNNINLYSKVGGTSSGAKKDYMYGVGAWGIGGDPAAINAASNHTALAHSNGLIHMGPVSGQNVRHTQNTYDEGANTEGFRAAWTKAINNGYDMVQYVTWNDYSEGGDIQPSTAKGHVPVDLGAWYIKRYKEGAFPEILRDVAILTHRTQFARVDSASEVSGSQTKFTTQRVLPTRTPARDMVEVLTFLTESATVNVQVGANNYTYTAPKGMNAQLYPLAVAGVGDITVQVVRNGVTVVNHATHSHVRQTPVIEDKIYHWSQSIRGIGTGIKQQMDPTANRPGWTAP